MINRISMMIIRKIFWNNTNHSLWEFSHMKNLIKIILNHYFNSNSINNNIINKIPLIAINNNSNNYDNLIVVLIRG